MTERVPSVRSEPEVPEADRQVADAIAAERAEANRLMISGVALGALDVVAIAALGVGCPLCAIGAPALLGWGAYRRWKVKRFEKAVADETARAEAPQDVVPGASPTVTPT